MGAFAKDREELAERLFQWMLAEGSYEILGARMAGYDLPDWIDYPLVDVIARNKYKNKIVVGLALTSNELAEPKTEIIPSSEKLLPAAGEWIQAIVHKPLSYPHDQIGQRPWLLIGIERQDEERLLELLHELGLRLELNLSIFVEIF